jgi:hypothetical protein
VVVPRPVVAQLGTRRVRVRIGDETFESTLGAYGGRTFLGLRTPLLTRLGLGAGDSVHVELEPGAPLEEPTVEVQPTTCAELDEALATDAALSEAWWSLPEGHREEYGRWISGGPDPASRRARIDRLRHRVLPG